MSRTITVLFIFSIFFRGKYYGTYLIDRVDHFNVWLPRVNANETEYVFYTLKYKVDRFRLPKLGETELKLSDNEKDLGYYEGSKLS